MTNAKKTAKKTANRTAKKTAKQAAKKTAKKTAATTKSVAAKASAAKASAAKRAKATPRDRSHVPAETSADSSLPKEIAEKQIAEKALAERDPRLPPPGTVLERKFKHQTYEVKVLDRDFKFRGRRYRSLSGIAKEITGSQTNGFLWFHLIPRPGTAKNTEQASA